MSHKETEFMRSDETGPTIEEYEAAGGEIMKLPSKERGCTGKANLGRSYVQQANKLAVKHGKRYGVYRCPHCGGTHLTTKIDKANQYAGLIHIAEPG